MGSRRAFVRTAAALVGGLPLVGSVGAVDTGSAITSGVAGDVDTTTAATAPNATTTSDTSTQRTATANRLPTNVTTLTGSANRTALRAARLPAGLAPLVSAFEQRFDSVSLDALESATGTAAVAGTTPIAGSATITGSVSTRALRRDLSRNGFTELESQRDGQSQEASTARFIADERAVAVALTESAIVLGYDSRVDADGSPASAPALAHVDATLEQSTRSPAGATLPARTAAHKLARRLPGDATGAVALDSSTRALLTGAVADADDAVSTVVDAAAALGAAARVRSAAETTLTYGVVAPPSRLSTETVESALSVDDPSSGTETPALRDVSVDRDGRFVLATATVDTEALVAAHARAFEIDADRDELLQALR
ncbi:hypothetical protein C482_07401 [Natrialba chahannaoensis JCM 10990]|uniref:Uncharacterized protein n=1 Tax=Natrialba chahannaoensis JCM 10990 TaxID=1227492 RepID=M0ARF0_9EURY|nr:hypothetical protein [Natrialba chahannaoensis]ELZ01301.1 hypothetical protein C482_07401 [Natrialba chahannaoensis JCM 10990]